VRVLALPKGRDPAGSDEGRRCEEDDRAARR
jgi:hypothetical protein